MSLARFDPNASLIRIPVRVVGAGSVEWLGMALDTGSNRTVIKEEVAWRLGYDLLSAPSVTVATASDVVQAHIISVRQISALGISVSDFPVLVMSLPEQLTAEGLLGLDFLRQRNLFCNFAKGILLTLPFAQNFFHRLALTVRLFAKL